jgi:protein gp37
MTTHIEWTHGDDGSSGMTWNPSTGCDQVSPGCDNCYALTMAKRLKGMGQAKYQRDGDPRTSGPGFGVSIHQHELDAPLRWRKPRRVFVDSMGDLFHDAVPDEFIARVWAVMALTPHHTYQVLTKRHGRMRSLLNSDEFTNTVIDIVADHPLLDRRREQGRWPVCEWDGSFPLPGVWLGVSVEDQKRADLRIPALLDTPAVVHFLSCEPLIGPVDLWFGHPASLAERAAMREIYPNGLPSNSLNAQIGAEQARRREGLHWVIVGGESGARARPCDPEWIRSLVKQCQAAGVPAFVKQLGSVWARQNGADSKGGDPQYWPEDLRIRQFPTVGAA